MFTCDKSRKLLFLSAWILIVLLKVDGKVWNDVTACYGSDDDCSRYRMQCPDGTSIVLGKLMYGTKDWLQECQYGISNCNEEKKVAACCGYNSSDTFAPFSKQNMSAIFEMCEGKSSCEGWAPRLAITPYSSYVWMQYACVNDKNITDMCQKNTISGNDLFIRFNMSSSTLQYSTDTPQDCSCQILTPDCNVAMLTTLIDLDFNFPKQDKSSTGCSTSFLEFVQLNKTYQCQNTELFTKEHTFRRMTEMIEHATNEIISLKNIIAGDELNVPNYIVLYFKTTPQQPLLVKCFAPGEEMHAAKWQCPTTKVSTKSTSSSQITTNSPSSKMSTIPYIVSFANNSRFSSTTSQLQSDSTLSMINNSLSPHSSTFSASITKSSSFSLNTNTASSTTLNTVTPVTKSETISPLSSKLLSRPFTKLLLIQSTTDTPSNKLPSVTRPKIDQPSTSPSVHAISFPSSFATTIASVQSISSSTDLKLLGSTYKTSKGLTSIESSHTEPPSAILSPLLTSTTTSIHAGSVSILNTTSSKLEASSVQIIGKSSTEVETTNIVDQNSNSNVDISSINTDLTTHSPAATTRKTEDDDGKNNNGLIIGITVGMVIIVMIIVAVVMVLLCIRIKRKEKVRRNYIRNTNIFYSFPEDYNEAGNTVSDSSPEMDGREPSFSTIPRSILYESVGNPSPSLTLKKASSPLYFDQYKIKSLNSNDQDGYDKDALPYSRMPSDSTYTSETSNETIDFVNGIENANSSQVDSNSNVENGGKTVTFDPSILYAKVKKEGRTKF